MMTAPPPPPPKLNEGSLVTGLKTPNPKSPGHSITTTPGSTITTSRFHFHSDTKAPSQLTELEKETYSRHTQFRIRLNDIDRKIAKWTSRATSEVIERDLELVGLYDWLACDPLERCSQRIVDKLEGKLSALWGGNDNDENGDSISEDYSFVGSSNAAESNKQEQGLIGEDPSSASFVDVPPNTDLDTSSNNNKEVKSDQESKKEESNIINKNGSNQLEIVDQNPADTSATIQSITNKTTNLSNNLNNYVLKTIPECYQRHLNSIETEFQSNLPPKYHLEKTKAAKREGSIVRRFESMAGTAMSSQLDESSTRFAELQLLEEKIGKAGVLNEERAAVFMKQIEEIRTMLEEEREERVRQDELIVNQLIETREKMQNIVESLMED